MTTITINGVTFNDFGANNYSNGMHLISCYPMPENMVQDVLAGKFEGVYLNPSARCQYEFYGLLGSAEQYEEVKKRQEEAQIASQVMSMAGGFAAMQKLPIEDWKRIEQEVRSAYKNWWES